MYRILITDGLDKAALAQLRQLGFTVDEQFYPSEELGAALQQYDAVVVRSATKVRKEHIDLAKEGKLKLVIRGGVGVDNIDVAYAEAQGIWVRNTPAASSNSVAELALAHMLSCARFISIAGHSMRQGKWEKKAYGAGIELSGKTLGVIGYGRIGRALGQKAQALGMQVLAYDVYQDERLVCDTMHYVSLEELLRQSDFISLHTPSLDGKPLICADTIAQMKDGVIFINTSRGGNVDESALLAGLESGKVRAAGLDVFAEEPSRNEALLQHPRVSCTPHIAASTGEAQGRIGGEVVAILQETFGL